VRQHAGMPFYEVHTLAQNRWLIDGLFFDKETAIEDAKLMLSRTQTFEAVRVLQVEERDSGFYEWTIFLATRPRPRRRLDGEPEAEAAALLPLAAAEPPPARPAPAFASRPRAPVHAEPSAAPALLVALLALFGFLILFSHRPKQPEPVWLFDRPEAWQPHDLRNPWTGEGSQ